MNNKSSHLSKRFLEVYETNEWGDSESVSGPGSKIGSEAVLKSIESLDLTISKYNISSIADIPCGDFNWFDSVLKLHPCIKYIGIDIVEPLILKNKIKFPNLSFECADVTCVVPPKVDLIFTKEMFIHLRNSDVSLAINNFRESRSKYLLSLNHFDFINIELALDKGGYCRPLDLCGEPYNFPEPIWRHSNFGLWDLKII